MVALRVEIEKKVRELARRHSLDPQPPLRRLLDMLLEKRVLEQTTVNGLIDLIDVGNRAAMEFKSTMTLRSGRTTMRILFSTSSIVRSLSGGSRPNKPLKLTVGKRGLPIPSPRCGEAAA